MSRAGIHPRRVMPDARCGGTLDGMATAPAQLLVYRFGTDAGFEGHLVGALERIEAGGSMQVLDLLFVARDGTGDLAAVDLHGARAGGGMVSSLLSFRLDAAARRRITRRVVAGAHADLIAALAATLEPGHALAAVLVGHEWARAVADAVDRTGGSALINDIVGPTSLTELGPALIEAATGGSAPV